MMRQDSVPGCVSALALIASQVSQFSEDGSEGSRQQFEYGWNGSRWIKLVGADPTCGASVQILTVVDFAARTPTVTWYADGLPLTTKDDEWAIPLETSALKLKSFYATATIESLSGDYDIGDKGFLLHIR